jgi:LacI family transcriptional regulator
MENSPERIYSYSRNSYRLGYETAAVLDRLMKGRTPPPGDILVPSDGVVARRSTDTIAVEDRHVAAVRKDERWERKEEG